MTGEFENRESGNLGELPDLISEERGELYDKQPVSNPGPGGILDPRYRLPYDIQKENDARNLQGTIGSPSIQALVDSVFDTRPVNARDFRTVGSDYILVPNGSTKSSIDFTHTIPGGYIGILRGFKYRSLINFAFPTTSYTAIAAAPSTNAFDILDVTLLVDNVIVPDYEKMKLGQAVDMLLPTHVIGNENKNFTLRLEASNYFLNSVIGGLLGAASVLFSLELYGNHLQSRGLPVSFENISQKL